MQMEHTQLQRLNMNLSHSLQIQMRHGAVYVYIVHATTRRGWRVLVEAHERYNKRHNSATISVYFKERAVGAVALPAHSSSHKLSGLGEWTAEDEHH